MWRRIQCGELRFEITTVPEGGKKKELISVTLKEKTESFIAESFKVIMLKEKSYVMSEPVKEVFVSC